LGAIFNGFFRKIDLEINIDYCDTGRDISFVAHGQMAKHLIKEPLSKSIIFI